ncbi:hypothetical protein M885DRAFT_558540 [Pelagophyceae sp. CCMP2097]|nr:hypothetical protein M885DRAFT_558540 [Pelagophyceae sp. CCMP2097]
MAAGPWRRLVVGLHLLACTAEFVAEDMPALSKLRKRYLGVAVHLDLASGRQTAQLRFGATAAVLLHEACGDRHGCGTLLNARRFRAAAAAAVLVADPSGLGTLAWELDEAEAEIGEAAPIAKVGIFLIHSTSDAALNLMAWSLREAFPPTTEGVASLTPPRLHVLCGPGPNAQGYDSQFWLERFSGRRTLLGGVHLMTNVNPFVPPTLLLHQGNYMTKACAMPRIATLQGYDHVVSSDDDVFVPPHAWRAFVWASSGSGGARLAQAGCTVATPLIHNAVPTGRVFAERALGVSAVQALDACFANSTLGYKGKIHMDQIPQPISPWNESFWWDKLAGVTSLCKGGHPIRWNKKCMALSLDLAMGQVGEWWDRGLDAAFEAGLEVHGPGVNPYPYFTNTLWMSTAKHYAAALDRTDLFVDVFDEVPLNIYTIQEKHGALCTLAGAYVVHPAYNYLKDKAERVAAVARGIEAHAADQIARAAAKPAEPDVKASTKPKKKPRPE